MKTFFANLEKIESRINHKSPISINVLYALFMVFQLSTYYFFSNITLHYNLNWWTPQLLIDSAIPFFLPMVICYILYFPLMVTPIFAPIKKEKEKRLIVSMILASLTNYIFSFTITRAVVPHASLSGEKEGFMLDILIWIYENDPGGLYFPSMHVAHSMLIGLYFWQKKSFKKILLLMAVLVSISTVFVKQHFVLDPIGGILLAIGIYYVTPYIMTRFFKIKLEGR